MKRVHLKNRLDRERYLMVLQQVQVKYMQIEISDGHATGAFKLQARERYLMVMQRVQLKYRLERYI